MEKGSFCLHTINRKGENNDVADKLVISRADSKDLQEGFNKVSDGWYQFVPKASGLYNISNLQKIEGDAEEPVHEHRYKISIEKDVAANSNQDEGEIDSSEEAFSSENSFDKDSFDKEDKNSQNDSLLEQNGKMRTEIKVLLVISGLAVLMIILTIVFKRKFR